MGGYGVAPGGTASLSDIITGFGQQKADIAHTQAQTAGTQEATLTQQQATRAAQLENQQRELALRDANITRNAMTQVEPLPNEDPAQYLGRIVDHTRKNGISAGGYVGLTKTLASALETKSKLAGESLAQHGQAMEQAGNLLTALKTAPPDQIESAYARLQPGLDKLEPGVFPPQLPADPIQRQGLIDQWAATHKVTSNLLGQQKAAADIAHTQAQTASSIGGEQRAAALQASAEEEAAAKAKTATLTAAGQAPIQPTEQAHLDQAKQTAAELHRHNVSEEGIARVNAAVAQGHLAQEQMVNGQKYGPGTAEYWAEQLLQNPDSVKELPAEMRSTVGKAFTAKTGLPLPTPLSAATQTQETAARTALDGAQFIRTAMQNPEIQKQIGPILGRLGNAEQSVGAAVGLSPEATQLAQELRTRMRYFIFQEGKAVLGGRLPQSLMAKLEESSPSVKMEPAMLRGAIDGAVGNAQSVLDNADKQRFGGKMRSREQRGQASPPIAAMPKSGDVRQYQGSSYKFDGKEWVRQ